MPVMKCHCNTSNYMTVNTSGVQRIYGQAFSRAQVPGNFTDTVGCNNALGGANNFIRTDMKKLLICVMVMTPFILTSCGDGTPGTGYSGADLTGKVEVTRDKATKAATLTVNDEGAWG